jgi:hypothetical protein
MYRRLVKKFKEGHLMGVFSIDPLEIMGYGWVFVIPEAGCGVSSNWLRVDVCLGPSGEFLVCHLSREGSLVLTWLSVPPNIPTFQNIFFGKGTMKFLLATSC